MELKFNYVNGDTVVMVEIARYEDYDPERPNATPNNKWKVIPQPKAMTYIREDYDSEESGRTLNLRMFRDRLGTKIKLEFEWGYTKLSDVKELLQLIDSDSFWVRFVDPFSGEHKVYEMYAGNKSLPYYNVLRDANGQPVIGFESLSINFIEM